jgi:hypothetical protein
MTAVVGFVLFEGWFRQCDLIPYSNDVDLGVWIKDYQEGVIPGLRHSGLTLIHQFGKVTH